MPKSINDKESKLKNNTDRSGNSAAINSSAPSFLLKRNAHRGRTSGFMLVSFNSATCSLNEMAYNSLLI